MKTNSTPDWESRWRQRVDLARHAAPPAVDVRPAVLAALRADPVVTDSWIQEFGALFGRARAFAACAAGAAACVGFALWQGYAALDSIEPWARWLLLGTWLGGAS